MGFWDILNGKKKANGEEIAREIVKLKADLPVYEKNVTDLDERLFRLRQQRIGGGKVSAQEMDSVSGQLNTARLDLETVKRSLTELEQKLVEACRTKLESETADCAKRLQAVKEEITGMEDELVDLAATLRFKQMQISGDSVPGRGIGISFSDFPEKQKLFLDKIKALQNGVTDGVSPEKKKRQLEAALLQLNKTDAKQMAVDLLEKMGGRIEPADKS